MNMTDLTPEERRKIYLEEKARMEIRQELQGKKSGAGRVIGIIVLAGIGLMAVLFVIGSALESSRDAEFNGLSPEQRRVETLKNCVSLMQSWRFKTYGEMSILERQMQAACAEQLRHPDQDVIKSSR